MADEPLQGEALGLAERLLELLRAADSASLDAVQDPARKVRLRFELDAFRREAADIGERLMELGGLPLAQRAALEVRRSSARLCDMLEDVWASRMPGYERLKFLP